MQDFNKSVEVLINVQRGENRWIRLTNMLGQYKVEQNKYKVNDR